jgi:7,8-dihydroneopterin aldolase/epimerase/oxygenase
VIDVIELRDLRCRVIVGLLEHERENTQPISIDIDIRRSFERAAQSDDVTNTTNYASIITMAERIATEGEFLLLETLVTRIAQAILDFDGAVDAATVAVRKLEPPVPESIGTVGVRTTLTR